MLKKRHAETEEKLDEQRCKMQKLEGKAKTFTATLLGMEKRQMRIRNSQVCEQEDVDDQVQGFFANSVPPAVRSNVLVFGGTR